MSFVFGARFYNTEIQLNTMPHGVVGFTNSKNNQFKLLQNLSATAHNTIPDWTPHGISRDYFLRDNLWLWYNGVPAFKTLEDAWNGFSPDYYMKFSSCELVLLELKNSGLNHIHRYEGHIEKMEWWEYNTFTKMYHVDKEFFSKDRVRAPENLNEILKRCIWENEDFNEER